MRAFMGAFAAVTLSLVLAACGGDGDSASDSASDQAPANAAAASTATVKVADSELGQIMVDEFGRTLYAFTQDKEKSSNCGEECIAVWPALTSAKTAVAGEGANSALLGQTESTKGQQQATYGEWPLYYYVGDMVAGDLNGQGIDDEWFVVSPDGKLIKKAAA
jgi:predicted lipoprotein with Yx(FWY)xxD motif